MERVTVYVSGDVQGVGFRYWARRRARELGLAGHAKNLRDGRVQLVVQGDPDAVDTFVSLLEESPSRAGRPGRVAGVDAQRGPAEPGVDAFTAE